MIPTQDLLRHARAMSDYEFDTDFEDCVLPLADPADLTTLRSYARRRRAQPSFRQNVRDLRRRHEHIKSERSKKGHH